MANELDALLARVEDDALRQDLRVQLDRLRLKRQFGLVYEEHLPERVVLPQHPIRRGSKVLRRANEADDELRLVRKVVDGNAVLVSDDGEVHTVAVSDLVAVAEFGQPVYPGLTRLGSLRRGGDKPAHVIVKADNYHALEALQFTHAGKVDCIYIDPPYNTGARDWKYNNDYVDREDAYRHSKWLAFMQRRLILAKQLLKPEGSVLIVTIDENEVHRLALLLDQTFRGHRTQMVTSVVNPRGKYRAGEFSRTEEYIFFVTLGDAAVGGEPDEDFSEGSRIGWRTLRRSDVTSARGTMKGGKSQFYPIYVDGTTRSIAGIGEPLPPEVDRTTVPVRDGCVAVFPVRDDGTEMNWGLTGGSLAELLSQGFVRIGRPTPDKPQTYQISYLTSGRVEDIESGRARVVGYEESGAAVVEYVTDKLRMPSSNWVISSHNAETGGTNLVKTLLGDKRFDYPKSLYAVEDTIGHFIRQKPNAVVLDFFAGSGTTVHAVARLNRQDGGRRQTILVTNNEVSASDASALRDAGQAPGDPQWEALGIFERVTRPRITAAMTGATPEGDPIEGDYAVSDEFPMAEGFDENVEFVELCYLDADDIELDMAFAGIASLLWLRAGARGLIIEERSDSTGKNKPYAMTDTYGVLFNTDYWRSFVDKLAPTVKTIFVVTDSASEFAGVAAELPTGTDVVRLYENYLTTFSINRSSSTP